jgi:hypothetical protein
MAARCQKRPEWQSSSPRDRQIKESASRRDRQIKELPEIEKAFVVSLGCQPAQRAGSISPFRAESFAAGLEDPFAGVFSAQHRAVAEVADFAAQVVGLKWQPP